MHTQLLIYTHVNTHACVPTHTSHTCIPMHTHALHTHLYPCTHMYAHAHIYQCTHITHICTHFIHIHTDTCMLAKRADLSSRWQSPVGPAGHRGTCSVSPMCQDEVGAPALRELGSGWGNTACLKDSGQWRGELCLAVIQPQRPSPPFSSWGGKGGDRPSMKGKTPTANKSGRWLVAFC